MQVAEPAIEEECKKGRGEGSGKTIACDRFCILQCWLCNLPCSLTASQWGRRCQIPLRAAFASFALPDPIALPR